MVSMSSNHSLNLHLPKSLGPWAEFNSFLKDEKGLMDRLDIKNFNEIFIELN